MFLILGIRTQRPNRLQIIRLKGLTFIVVDLRRKMPTSGLSAASPPNGGRPSTRSFYSFPFALRCRHRKPPTQGELFKVSRHPTALHGTAIRLSLQRRQSGPTVRLAGFASTQIGSEEKLQARWEQ